MKAELVLVAEPSATVSRVDLDTGEFWFEGLQPGRHFVRPIWNSGGAVMSITWNGRDYAESGFDTSAGTDFTGVVVRLKPKGARLSGVVHTSAGKLAADAAVLLFPPDRATWATTQRAGLVWVNNRGAFQLSSLGFSGLPAGDYLLVSVPGSQVSRWRDPEFLAAAARVATRVSVGWDETKTQDLVLQDGIK